MNWTPIPSTKAPSLDEAITAATGINRKQAISGKTCPCCGSSVTLDSFRDKLSLKEFHISGLCQTCQDEVFGG